MSQHKHKYEGHRVAKINILQDKYKGNPGDMAFIIAKCKCSQYKVFDYGTTEQMEKKCGELYGTGAKGK